MPYRPSYAGFDFNVVSTLAGVFPASVMAAGVGSALTITTTLAYAAIDGGLPAFETILAGLLGALLLFILVTVVATAFCAFYIAVIGVPLAVIMGRHLARPLGLGVAIAGAMAGTFVVAAVFETWPFGRTHWALTAMVAAYALPAGTLYRRAVLDARRFSPFAEQQLAPAT